MGFASCYLTIILKEEEVNEAVVPVHYHSSFSQAHEFLPGSQVSLIEAAVSPFHLSQHPLHCQHELGEVHRLVLKLATLWQASLFFCCLHHH